MKAIITQRETLDSYGVSIDVLESTYVNYFEKLNLELFILSNFSNNLEKYLYENKFDLIILTGGGSLNSKFYRDSHNDYLQLGRDNLEWKLMEYSLEKNIPILAICRGMQHINAFLGGKITKLKKLKVERPIGVEHPIVLTDGIKIFVNNYHNYGILNKDIAKGYDIVGIDEENGVIEAIYSEERRWLGVQWHPERMMKDKFSREKCNEMIKKFIKGENIYESDYFSSGTRN